MRSPAKGPTLVRKEREQGWATQTLFVWATRQNLLGINQAAVSKMERRADMYISTLQSMIRAMGGRLKIEAVFPEGKVEINQLRKLKKSAGAD